MLLIHPALRLGTLLLHYIIAISSFFVSIHVFFFILRSFTVGCGKSKIFASPVLFLLFLFFLLLFSVIILFLNEMMIIITSKLRRDLLEVFKCLRFSNVLTTLEVTTLLNKNNAKKNPHIVRIFSHCFFQSQVQVQQCYLLTLVRVLVVGVVMLMFMQCLFFIIIIFELDG